MDIGEQKVPIPIVEKTLEEKISEYEKFRHAIKKKRFVFDEGKEKFGLDEFTQLMKVKNTSEVKGYPFKGWKNSDPFKFGVKIVPIETKYDKTNHPCHLESIFLKELTDLVVNKKVSPHITHFLGSFKVSNKCRALKMLNLKKLEVEERIRTHSIVLVSEFVSGGSLDNWIFNQYENDKSITDVQWKAIVFQLIYTIAVIQTKYRMMHNDFHYGNILVDDAIKPGGYFVYTIDNKTYYIPNTGVIPKLWDFEFAMAYSNTIEGVYPNKFIVGKYEYDAKNHVTIVPDQNEPINTDDTDDDCNVPLNYNEFYDLHYFLTSLLDLYISQELFDWIMSLYPEELIPEEELSETGTNTESDTESNDTESNGTESNGTESNGTESNGDTDTTVDTTGDTTVDTEGDTEEEEMYLVSGRMINGVEKKFTLPTPLTALSHDFFSSFLVKPDDFDESTAMYFSLGL